MTERDMVPVLLIQPVPNVTIWPFYGKGHLTAAFAQKMPNEVERLKTIRAAIVEREAHLKAHAQAVEQLEKDLQLLHAELNVAISTEDLQDGQTQDTAGKD